MPVFIFTPSYNGTQYLLKKYGLPYMSVDHILYRGGGWPGRMLIQIHQKSFTIPYMEYWPIISPWFLFNRCTICASGLNIQSDISCGDAWLPELMRDDNKGTSVLCSRTKLGEQVLKAAHTGGYIQLHPISRKTLIRTQRSMFGFKHHRLNARLKILNLFMRKQLIRNVIPEELNSVKPHIYFDEFLLFLGRRLASRKGWWPLFNSFRIVLRLVNSFAQFLGRLIKQ